jgi:aryl-alcohol dehydrogenase-like predicted oxidoreductase
VLTGKYKPGEPIPHDSRAASDAMSHYMDLVLTDDTLDAVQRLVPIAEGAGLTLPEMALAWVLRREELASAIVGASRPEQVHANARAAGIVLSSDVLEAIDDALGDVPVKVPTLAPFAPEGVKYRS